MTISVTGFDTNTEPPALAWLRRLTGTRSLRQREGGRCHGEIRRRPVETRQRTCPTPEARPLELPGHRRRDGEPRGTPAAPRLDLRETKITDAGLRHLEGLSQLQRLYLFHVSVTDAGMESLAKLSQLNDLEVSNTKVSQSGLEKLKGLTHIRKLGLGTIAVSDAGLRHLEAWPQTPSDLPPIHQRERRRADTFHRIDPARSVDLHATHVTGTGLDVVKTLPHLSWMELGGPNVTNAALEHLKGMTQLRSLEIGGPQITDAGLANSKE